MTNLLFHTLPTLWINYDTKTIWPQAPYLISIHLYVINGHHLYIKCQERSDKIASCTTKDTIILHSFQRCIIDILKKFRLDKLLRNSYCTHHSTWEINWRIQQNLNTILIYYDLSCRSLEQMSISYFSKTPNDTCVVLFLLLLP